MEPKDNKAIRSTLSMLGSGKARAPLPVGPGSRSSNGGRRPWFAEIRSYKTNINTFLEWQLYYKVCEKYIKKEM